MTAPDDLPSPDTHEDATARIARQVASRVATEHAGLPLDALLAERLGGNELTTLLLNALRRRALRRGFRDVLEHSERLAMVRPSDVDARRVHAFEGVAYAAAADYEAVELSPVNPLGLGACVGVDPNNVLATVRFGEVAADPTPALALHGARRRRHDRTTATLRFCASQRMLRMQPTDQPNFTPHFRLFALATMVRAARASEGERSDRAALLEHLLTWADLFARLPAAGFRVAGLRIVLSDTRVVAACLRARGIDPVALARRSPAHKPDAATQLLADVGVTLPRDAADMVEQAATLVASEQHRVKALADEVVAPLRERWPSVPVVFDFARLQGIGYYRGPCIQLRVRRDDGLELPIGDGGSLDWMSELLSDRRERMVATGIGSELLLKVFDGTKG